VRIRTRIQASVVFAAAIATTAGIVLLIGLGSVQTAIGHGQQAAQTLGHTFDLSMLTTDYVINHEPRADRQWHEKHEQLTAALASLEAHSEEEVAALDRLHANLRQAFTTFEEITSVHSRALAGEVDSDVALEYESRLTSRLLVLMQSMVSDATILRTNADAQAREAEELTITLVMSVSALGVLTMIVIGVSTDRLIVKPLESLQHVASKVGRGDLSVRTGISSKDEVGEFASGFDTMVGSLERSYAMLENEISERRRAEAALGEYRDNLETTVQKRTSELVVLNEDLQRATRAKDDFLASMSHELRTPLNSVLGFTDLMLKGLTGPLNPEQERQLGMVHQAGHQLLDLVNQVLELSRIDAGKLRVVVAPFSPAAAAGRIAEMMAPVAQAKGLEIVGRAEDTAPERMVSDEGKVDQIILNLLSNAIKFTREGQVEIVVRADGSDAVAFDVCDTGIGIPAEELSAIFEHFHQVLPSGPTNEVGTGLGLAIARRLAESLGGDVKVTSEVGAGSTFTLTLPLAYASDGVNPVPAG